MIDDMELEIDKAEEKCKTIKSELDFKEKVLSNYTT